MPSIIPGYQYDIFISYRQNDNRSGWVTEFVSALQDELAATLKDPVSIYFDSNPHDGLHETHDVDGSLKEKVKCLVFLPIVSQTYCDSNAFAWKSEFLPFLEFANQDEFGLDVKLPGGNVTKRVLPVRIHEIDSEDQQLFEQQIGGIMRPVDFIYRETGVNRPLAPGDSEEKNLNATKYVNQVNKVANAIKDIVTGLKSQDKPSGTFTDPQKEMIGNLRKAGLAHSKRNQRRWIAAIFIIAILALIYFGLSWTQRNGETAIDESIEKSIAVLPFVDLSPAKDQEYFADGLTEEIINVLMQIPQLKVVGRTSSFSFKNSEETAQNIGQSLNASYLLQGSVRKSGNLIRIQASLIDTKTGFNVKSYPFPETTLENIFSLQDEIAQSITNDLRVSLFTSTGGQIATSHTENLEALEEFFRGRRLWYERKDFPEAIDHFKKAISLDPKYSRAYAALAETYTVLPTYSGDYSLQELAQEADLAINNSLRLNPDNPEALTAKGRMEYKFNLNIEEAEKAFLKAIELNPNYGPGLFWYAIFLSEIGRHDKVLDYYQAAVELEPRWAVLRYAMGLHYLNIDDLSNAKNTFAMGKEIQPDYSNNLYSDFLIDIYTNDFSAALLSWQRYYSRRCGEFGCNEQDSIVTSELLTSLVTKEEVKDLQQKLQGLSMGRDRVLFSALMEDREVLYSELRKILKENSYEFWRFFYRESVMKKYSNDPEFKEIAREIGTM